MARAIVAQKILKVVTNEIINPVQFQWIGGSVTTEVH